MRPDSEGHVDQQPSTIIQEEPEEEKSERPETPKEPIDVAPEGEGDSPVVAEEP